MLAPMTKSKNLPALAVERTNVGQNTLSGEVKKDAQSETSRRGPPNRMNDLSYTEWMRFQKSFFRYENDPKLIQDCIQFFTKARWADSSPSRSLVLGFDVHPDEVALPPRSVTVVAERSVPLMITEMRNRVFPLFDFAIVDLSSQLRTEGEVDDFLRTYSSDFFRALRGVLRNDQYCCTTVGFQGTSGTGFPIPWSIALAARDHIRLRDEKIGLDEKRGGLKYCLFFQATDDRRPSSYLYSNSISMVPEGVSVPLWIIPKSPPRKKSEKLHPAKFPETLVSKFIELFTKPGETVFDPMVGTGSAVLAAMQLGRNAVGIDLISDFINIARDRILDAFPSAMLASGKHAKWQLIQGDATRLDEIVELRGVTFHYVITSPPYWSVLRNPGSEYQRERRQKKLLLAYSDNPKDIGNIADYDAALSMIVDVYKHVSRHLEDGRMFTVIVKNLKRHHISYPYAWDLVRKLCEPSSPLEYLGTTLWCQDDVPMRPFALGTHWVSNVVHHYCLHFRKKRTYPQTHFSNAVEHGNMIEPSPSPIPSVEQMLRS
jgi:hypothetical protein